MWPMIRSILAVVAGIVVLTIVSFAIEAVADPLLMRMFPAALPDAAALSANFPARLFMLAYTLVLHRRRRVLHRVDRQPLPGWACRNHGRNRSRAHSIHHDRRALSGGAPGPALVVDRGNDPDDTGSRSSAA